MCPTRSLQHPTMTGTAPTNPTPHAEELNPQLLFKQAHALYEQGQWSAAQALCERIREVAPTHDAAWHLSGIIAAQSQQLVLADSLFAQAIAIKPHSALAHAHRGINLLALRRFEQALASFDAALALKPSDIDCLLNRGVALFELQRLDEALASCERALQIQPNFAQAHSNRGNVLQALEQFDEALRAYDRALAIQADFVDALYNRANVLQKMGRLEQALDGYSRATACQPHHAQAYANRGNVLLELKRPHEALASYAQALAADPHHAKAYASQGLALLELGQHEAALHSLEQAITLAPEPEALLNRGVVLHKMGHLAQALASYEQAVAAKPDYAEAWSNTGNVLQELHRMDEALAAYDRALRHAPDHPDIGFNRAHLFLLTGDFDAGWAAYEARFSHRDYQAFVRTFAAPKWSGQADIAGKTILLYAEQGLGDVIQFCRYAKQVQSLGAQVVLEVPPALHSLMTELEGVNTLLCTGQPLPALDYHCPLLSLPYALGTRLDNIPSAQAYLRADPKQVAMWSARLGVKQAARVGLVWRGSPTHRNDATRSVALPTLLQHLPPGHDYICLQKELTAPEQALLAQHRVHNHSALLHDFSDTAALCALCDVVLSVDTSVAHLSAALGQTTWILVTHAPDWRWLLKRDDSPWYASVTLYRQGPDRQWPGVLQRVALDLAARPPAATPPAAAD